MHARVRACECLEVICICTPPHTHTHTDLQTDRHTHTDDHRMVENIGVRNRQIGQPSPKFNTQCMHVCSSGFLFL